jgi:hypothetical protein
LRRPFAAELGLSLNFQEWTKTFVHFIESRGYTMEYCTSLDIQKSPDLPTNYGVVISAGHDEYYSRQMRESLERHVASGGSVLFFGGNTCWWQIRFDGDERITCFKSSLLDPLTGITDSLVTVRWFDSPVFHPENSLTGASFLHAEYVNFDGKYMAADGYGGYWVYHTNHWAFEGTHLSDGDTLGRPEAIVGYETDGALWHWNNGEPVVSGGDGTPSNYVILGMSPANWGTATMGLYETPGLVFNAGTTGWTSGLVADSLVQRITLNVVNRALASTALLGVGRPELDATRLSIRVQPNPARGSVTIRWSGRGVASGVGLTILDVSGARWARPTVRATPDGALAEWNTCDRAGRPAPPGIYFARVEGVGMRAVGRFMIVR